MIQGINKFFQCTQYCGVTNALEENGKVEPSKVDSYEKSSVSPYDNTLYSSITASSTVAKKENFYSMSNQDMRDWVNDQIRSGKMSLDDSTPFVYMTLHIPVQASHSLDSTATERVNFVEKARLGIEGALSLNDASSAKKLQKALVIMLEN